MIEVQAYRAAYREVTSHRREWDEDFVDVPPVVTGVLFLGRHHTDYGERNVVEKTNARQMAAANSCFFASSRETLRVGFP